MVGQARGAYGFVCLMCIRSPQPGVAIKLLQRFAGFLLSPRSNLLIPAFSFLNNQTCSLLLRRVLEPLGLQNVPLPRGVTATESVSITLIVIVIFILTKRRVGFSLGCRTPGCSFARSLFFRKWYDFAITIGDRWVTARAGGPMRPRKELRVGVRSIAEHGVCDKML